MDIPSTRHIPEDGLLKFPIYKDLSIYGYSIHLAHSWRRFAEIPHIWRIVNIWIFHPPGTFLKTVCWNSPYIKNCQYMDIPSTRHIPEDSLLKFPIYKEFPSNKTGLKLGFILQYLNNLFRLPLLLGNQIFFYEKWGRQGDQPYYWDISLPYTWCVLWPCSFIWILQLTSNRKWIFFLTHGSVHHDSMLIKVQLDATVCRHLFSVTSLYMFRVSCTHHQEY